MTGRVDPVLPSGPQPPGSAFEKPEAQRISWFALFRDRWWLLFLAAVGIIVLLILLVPRPYQEIFLYLQDGIWVTLRLTISSFIFIILPRLV